jgi:Flp pilus assembly protein TadG
VNIIRRFKRGNSYLEFSVAAVPLLLFLFGTINFALAVYDYNFTSYVAREATRYAAVRGSSSPNPAATSDVTNFVLAKAHGLDSSNLKVTTTWSPDNSPGSVVRVQVQYKFIFNMFMVKLSPVNLTSTSQMVIAQ